MKLSRRLEREIETIRSSFQFCLHSYIDYIRVKLESKKEMISGGLMMWEMYGGNWTKLSWWIAKKENFHSSVYGLEINWGSRQENFNFFSQHYIHQPDKKKEVYNMFHVKYVYSRIIFPIYTRGTGEMKEALIDRYHCLSL